MANQAPTDSNAQLVDAKKRLELVAALWSAFLAACFGSLVFFAQFDPPLLAGIASRFRLTDTLTGYAIGFFFFWIVGAIAALLTLMLVRQSPDDARPNDSAAPTRDP